MKNTLTALSLFVMFLMASVELLGKGETVKIIITGGDLTTPIEITDAAEVSRFQVYTGPGTSPNASIGLNVDWSQGKAEPPKGLPVYDVSFVTSRPDHGTYVVRYLIDPSNSRGLVYIPGKQDTEYRDNVWQIYRRVEGNWFHAWSVWDQLVQPLISAAKTSR